MRGSGLVLVALLVAVPALAQQLIIRAPVQGGAAAGAGGGPDVTAPTVESVRFDANTYVTNDVMTVTVRFTEPVSGAVPSLYVRVNGAAGANLQTTVPATPGHIVDQLREIEFPVTVPSNWTHDPTEAGDAFGGDFAFQVMDDGTLADAADNRVARSAWLRQGGIAINFDPPPTLDLVAGTAGSYTGGQGVPVRLTFSEPVYGTLPTVELVLNNGTDDGGADDVTVPALAPTGVGDAPGNASAVFDYGYVVADIDHDPAFSDLQISVSGGSLQDAGGSVLAPVTGSASQGGVTITGGGITTADVTLAHAGGAEFTARQWPSGPSTSGCDGYANPTGPGQEAQTVDGYYWIDDDAGGGAPAGNQRAVWCNFSLDPGYGWTLIYASSAQGHWDNRHAYTKSMSSAAPTTPFAPSDNSPGYFLHDLQPGLSEVMFAVSYDGDINNAEYAVVNYQAKYFDNQLQLDQNFGLNLIRHNLSYDYNNPHYLEWNGVESYSFIIEQFDHDPHYWGWAWIEYDGYDVFYYGSHCKAYSSYESMHCDHPQDSDNPYFTQPRADPAIARMWMFVR